MPAETPSDHRAVVDFVTTMASRAVLGHDDLDSATSPQLLEVITLASAIWDAARVGLDESVALARTRKCTWAEIGHALGVSRQAAFRRFGRKRRDQG